MMETEGLSLDRISALPENIIEYILTFMPIRDALRTSILSKKWQYSWRSMPKLVFTEKMIKAPPDCGVLKKYKLVSAIFHVLLLHNSPTIIKFNHWVFPLLMDSEFSQIISYLAKENKVKELILDNYNISYKLPLSFFSLQGLELINIQSCTFEPPLTFNKFSCLRSLKFYNVAVSAQILQRFLSKCPLLEHIILRRNQQSIEFVAGGNSFTFVDLLRCVPRIRSLEISSYYMKFFSSGDMPHKLRTTCHLQYLFLEVCLMEKIEISSALCLIRSSPLLRKITFNVDDNEKLPVQQTSTNFFDPENYTDMNLGHLEIFDINLLITCSPLVMDFVKLIMAKSPVLKKLQIKFSPWVSVDEEMKLLRNLVLHTFPRASPSSKLIIKRSPIN